MITIGPNVCEEAIPASPLCQELASNGNLLPLILFLA
jgi:hypothetical protein